MQAMGADRDRHTSPGGGSRRRHPLSVSAAGDPLARLLAAPLRHLTAAFDADTCSLVMADWATGRLNVRAAYGLGKDFKRLIISPRRLGEGIAGFVISHGKPLLLNNPGRDRRLRRISFTPRADISSSLCIPLAMNGTLAGTLNLTRKAGMPAFRPADLRLALALAKWLAPCVEQASRLARNGSCRRGDLRQHLQAASLLFSAVRRFNGVVTAGQAIECLRNAVRRAVGPVEQRYFVFDRVSIGGVQAQGNGVSLNALQSAAEKLSAPAWLGGKRLERLARRLGLDAGGPALLLPIRHSRTCGAALISGLEARPTEPQRALLSALAKHGADALRRAASYERVVGGRCLSVAGVNGAGAPVRQANTPQGAARYVMSLARSIMPFESAVVLVRNGGNGGLKKQSGTGRPWRLAKWEREAMHWALWHRRPLLADGCAGARSLAAIPMAVGRHSVGVLGLRGAQGSFSAQQARAVTALACHAAATAKTLQDAGRAGRYADDVVRSLIAGVVGIDELKRVVFWSPPAEQTLKFAAFEALGRPFDEVLQEIGNRSGWQGVGILGHLAAEAASGRWSGWREEIAMGDSPSRALHLSVACSPVRGAAGEREGAVLVIEDITDRKRAEAREQQLRQLASLGQMAANVAHEVRNPLSAIKTAAQLLAEEAVKGTTLEELATIINEECDRLGKLTDDFLAYARPRPPQIGAADVKKVVRRCLRLMSPIFDKHHIAASAKFHGELPAAAADHELLSQVVLNLLTNAAQAMQGISRGGRLMITGRARINGKRRELEISVTDTGPGIPPEHLGQIFEPFFTTKVRGTGLGLAIARQIVISHSGHIEAQSQPGRGTTVTVRLPAYRARPLTRGFLALPESAKNSPKRGFADGETPLEGVLTGGWPGMGRSLLSKPR